MQREGTSVIIETPQEAIRMATTMYMTYSDKTLRKTPEIVDMFIDGEDNNLDAFPRTLSEEASSRLIRSLETQRKRDGDTVQDSMRRLLAFFDLRQLGVIR